MEFCKKADREKIFGVMSPVFGGNFLIASFSQESILFLSKNGGAHRASGRRDYITTDAGARVS